MSLRSLSRRLWIDSLTTLRLDALARRRAARRPGPFVRIVLAHGTPRSAADAFRRQLDWARRHFDFLTFEQFRDLWSNPSAPPSRPCVLFTFDDGLADNLEVGAPILEEFGTRGVFFVVPRFAQQAGPEAASYFRDHLHGDSAADSRPLSPAQVRELADRGHTIGSHTFSHVRLSETPESDLPHEITDSRRILEEWTGRPVETFAWTFYWNAITPAAHRLAAQNHPFVFTPCPGLVSPRDDSRTLIWRTNVESNASLSLCRFMYSGLNDGIWASRRAELTAMLNASTAAPSA